MASPCFQFINTLPSFFAFLFTAELQPVHGFIVTNFHDFLVSKQRVLLYTGFKSHLKFVFNLNLFYNFLFLIYSSPSLLRPRASSGPGQNLHSKMRHQSAICCLRKELFWPYGLAPIFFWNETFLFVKIKKKSAKGRYLYYIT